MSNCNYGKCALCGKECELTFEHIPPRAAFNWLPAKPVSGYEITKNINTIPFTTEGLKYSNQQKGMGKYSLCSSCNNKTGSMYGDAYLEFAKRANYIANNEYGNKNIVKFKNIYPLRFFKQICSMFCSVNQELGLFDDIRLFVLDKDSNVFNCNKYRIQMFFTRTPSIMLKGYTVLLYQSHINNKSYIMKISEIIAYPFGFQLIIDPDKNVNYNGFNITEFATAKYGDLYDVEMPIIFYESNTVFPNSIRKVADNIS